MGYLNNVTGYRDDLLASRMIVKHGSFVLLTLDSLVKNIIPGFEDYDATTLSAPRLDVSFVGYLITLRQNGGNQQDFGGEGIEMLLYVTSGNITAKVGDKTFTLSKGGYLYHPSGSLVTLVNVQAEDSQILLYKCCYVPVEGHAPWLVSGNAGELEHIHYEGMDDVILLDFLSKELGFDMNIYIPSFAPGANHGYTETHVREHGAYILSGQGVYNLDNNWIPAKEGNYIFMGTYSLQAGYDVGRDEAFSYIYSKGCNRDVKI